MVFGMYLAYGKTVVVQDTFRQYTFAERVAFPQDNAPAVCERVIEVLDTSKFRCLAVGPLVFILRQRKNITPKLIETSSDDALCFGCTNPKRLR
jgi:hypothetical protein